MRFQDRSNQEMTEQAKNPLTWDAEKEHPEMCNMIKNALRAIRDPEIGMDVIQLGLIRNIAFKDNKLDIVMILTTPFCPYGPMLMEASRKAVEDATGIPTEITYGTEVWNQTMMEEGNNFNWGLF